MTQEELDALEAQHGGRAGTTAVGPSEGVDHAYDGTASEGAKTAIPDAKRQQKVVFKDGTYLTVQPKDDGSYDVVTPLGGASASKSPVLRAMPDGSIGLYDPETRTFTPTTGAKLSPEEIEANKQKAIHDQQERDYNSTHPGPDGKAYYLTHEELTKLQASQATQNLSAQQTQAQIDNLAADNKRADAQLSVSQQQANNADAREARLTAAAEKQADAEKAAADLAAKKADWDKEYQAGTLSLEQARLNYEQQYNEVKSKADAARLALDSATEANRVADAQRTDETTRRGQDITASDAAANRDVTSKRDAESAYHDRQTEVQNQYDSAARIGSEAATVATNSLPFMAPAGTHDSLDSIRNGMLANPAHPVAAPSVAAVPFPWDPTQLVQQLTAKALEQQSSYAKSLAQQPQTPYTQPAPPIIPTPAQIASSNTSAGLPPGMTSPTSGPGSAELPTGTPGTNFQTQPFLAPTGNTPTTTIAPDGTVTIQHTPGAAPQSDPAFAATTPDPTAVRGFR